MTGEQWENYLEELEGKYVILYNDKIGQIHNPYEKKRGSIYFELLQDEDEHQEYNMYSLKEGTEPVSNLYELIEPNDLIYIDMYPDDWGGITVGRIPETVSEADEYKSKIKNGDWKLIGIIKKEQINENTYWVPEDFM